MNDIGKGWRPLRQTATGSLLAERENELRSALRVRDPGLVAARTGGSFHEIGPDGGEFNIPIWGNVCILSFPELVGYGNRGDRLSEFQQTMLLYYLVTADGAPLTGKWVSLADLPDGRIYSSAFQGYTGNEIVKAFGMNLDLFTSACLRAGGKPVDFGSASFIFQALPRLPLMLTYWLGDEDFPSSCKVLFDESACHYVPIDACALLGSMLTQKVIRS
jgi:hypothetical protein